MLPSASRIDLALRCLGSATLPTVRESSEAASAGTELHAYLATAREDKAAALAAVPPELRERAEAIDLSIIPPGAEAEVALGYDARADQAIRYMLPGHRSYPVDGLWHGTADLVGRMGLKVFVGDFKTGWSMRRAADSMQLRFLALAAARLSGADEADVALLYERDGTWVVDRAHLDAMDLEETRLKLVALERRIDDGDPELHVGAHCGHCPALRLCPAQTSLVRAFSPDELAEERLVELTPTEGGAIYDRLEAFEVAINRARASLRAIAAALPEGLPLPDGRHLKQVKWSTQVKDEEAKQAIARVTEEMRAAGHITKRETTQIRVVGRAR